MLSDEAMFERMAKGWRAGQPETCCGNGSTMANTANIRKWLPNIVSEYSLASINDAGAGDLHWIRKVQWPRPIAYRAFDLIPRLDSIEKIDITRDEMPPCDAILCRMVLNHLDEPRIMMALDLFRRSARYLIATQFDGESLPQRSPQFTRLDLRGAPYMLGEPLAKVQDGSEDICSLALWKL